MSAIDWSVMLGTLFFIVAWGTWKTRGSRNIGDYLRGGGNDRWWAIGLSVMATQASAITFLSTPGQGYTGGMRFVQFYLGLPLAMIIISAVFIPLYYRLKVYTAYEFLESRFDLRTRLLTASLFLVQRGLAAGITIYAPAIILSQVLGWSLNFTILFIGGLVIIYTVSGGTRAVTHTHRQQMAVIFAGMFTAFGFLVYYISGYLSFGEALEVAGRLGRMNVIDLEFDPASRYNIWSGLIGGLFLQLSYFGTDQSQVQRYLSGRSVRESRLGLMFNGLLKIPMQFFILLTGVLVFVFYLFHTPPLHFNAGNEEFVRTSPVAELYGGIEDDYRDIHARQKVHTLMLRDALREGDDFTARTAAGFVQGDQEIMEHMRQGAVTNIKAAHPGADTEDADYIFITFIMNFLPVGVVGLLLAVIFSAGMSSTSAELNALGSTMTVDMYRRLYRREAPDHHYVRSSKLFTLLFGVLAVVFAILASLFENLIEAVNILGSLFYGTILGIFLVAFFVKRVGGKAVFIAAAVAQALIFFLYWLSYTERYEIGYLWYNLIGPVCVVSVAVAVEGMRSRQ